MADIYPPTVQRPALLKLEQALDCWHRAMRRDECGDWMIAGETGKIYAVPGGYQVIIGTPTPRHWTGARNKLKSMGARVTNDGETGGGAMLDRLPTSAEAPILRKLISVRKHAHMCDEHRERAIANLLPRPRGNRVETADDLPSCDREGGHQDRDRIEENSAVEEVL